MVELLKIKRAYIKNWGINITTNGHIFTIDIHIGKKTWMITW